MHSRQRSLLAALRHALVQAPQTLYRVWNRPYHCAFLLPCSTFLFHPCSLACEVVLGGTAMVAPHPASLCDCALWRGVVID
uniref:Uncharacterized protein n=1 Tax=Arundo donax TaxID=35708 RepID=A0A0A8YXK4_ARUDO